MNTSLFLLSVITVFSLLAFANTSRQKKIPDIVVEGVGVAKIIHQYLGEPISAPERLQIVIKCNKDGKTKELGLFRMCSLSESSYEPSPKILHLKLISGRVVHSSGDVVCDQVDMQQIDLGKACD